MWLSGATPTPLLAELPAGLAALGWPIQVLPEVAAAGRAARVMLADEAAELAAAARWARDRLTAGAQQIALVVPELERRRDEIRSELGHHLGSQTGLPAVHFAGGEPVLDLPALGAALTALELAQGSSDFGTVSRFLRSSFIGACASDVPAAVALEAELRRAPAHHWNLLRGLAEPGFRARLTRRHPGLAESLARAAAALDDSGGARPVSRWAELWQRYLAALGWPAGLPAEPQAEMLRLWQDLLAELAALNPVLPPLGQAAALAQLRRVAARLRHRRQSMELAAIEIVGRMADLGPDHDGVWIMGLDRDQWPPRPQPNPFLPLKLQRACGMPDADAGAARRAAEQAWQFARRSTSLLVASWPATRHEEATQPSRLLASLPDLPRPVRRERPKPPLAETVPDPAPPLSGKHIPGGTRGLALQSNCPLRAFLELRLGARELDRPTRGVAPWQRGVLAHRALELLYSSIRGSTDLAGGMPDAAQIDAVIKQAVRDQLGSVRGLQARVVALEAARLSRRISAFMEQERQRPAFQVAGLELRQTITLADHTIEARLDRLDQDAGGQLMVMDYKTGEARPGAWLKPRPADVQVPLYVLAVGSSVGAALIVDLKSEPPRYRGLWVSSLKLPGRSALGELSLDNLSRQWRAELTQLAAELAAGDARLLPDRPGDAQGSYAPATRIYQWLAP
jgi:probable DNA repair protein